MRIGSEFRLLAPLAATAIVATAVFVLSLVVWSYQVDAGAREREESLVQQGVLARITEIEDAVAAQTDWDGAVAHIDNRLDTAWIRSTLVSDLAQAAEFDDVVVIDGENQRVFPAEFPTTAPAARALMDEVRLAESLRPAVRVAGQDGAGAPEPIQRSAFVLSRGKVRLLTATLVQPRLGKLKGRRAPVIVTGQAIAPGFLTLMRERFQLEPLSVSTDKAPARRGRAQVVFDTADGPPLALSWTPQRPGAALLQRAFLPMLLILLTFSGVGLAMLHQARRAARELLASSRAQSEFMANMSHEIRTPLNGVVAVADALARTRLDTQQDELVQIIRASGETLERLLSDILDLARIETGAVAIENEPFNLAEAVRSSVALQRSRAQEKAIDLVVRIDPLAEAAVVGDQVRLKQILTNLISNAVKFTMVGGVTVEASPGGDKGGWRFTVEDTGVGFDPSLRERIFGRFQQADGSVTRRFGGTGLGLAICRQLTELMGGAIEAQGRPGVGARFTLWLPFPLHAAPIAGASEPATAADAGAAPDRRLRVLLADDHPTNRRVVEVLLAELDIDLVATENGLEACEAFESQPFDAVLMDMQMPVMDGLTATRRIRAFEARRGLGPTFLTMLTANALRDHQEASLAAGADMHLPKPIEAARLFAALAQAGERAARQEAA